MSKRYLVYLGAAQALVAAVLSALMFVAALLSIDMGISGSLLTLPISILIIGIAIGSFFANYLISRFGQRKTYIAFSAVQSIAILLVSLAILTSLFSIYLFACFTIGVTISVFNQFRFTAISFVQPENASKAISFILFGNILSAWLGPELITFGYDVFLSGYAGSFLLLALASVISVVFLLCIDSSAYSNQLDPTLKFKMPRFSAGLKTIEGNATAKLAVLSGVIGFGIMTLLMTSTPISMHNHALHLSDTKTVIQHHVMMMFMPSLITPFIISKLGNSGTIFLGLSFYLLAGGIALLGTSFNHYWLSMVLVGIGWNFLFITSTVLMASANPNNDNSMSMNTTYETLLFGTQALAALTSSFAIHLLGWDGLIYTSLLLIFLAIFAVGFNTEDRSLTKTS